MSADQPQVMPTSTSTVSTASVTSVFTWAFIRRPPRSSAAGSRCRARPSSVISCTRACRTVPLLQRGAQGAVQPVLEVELAAPPHHVGEQVAVEGGVLVEQRVEPQRVLGGHQLVEPHLARREGGPLPWASARAAGYGRPSPTRLKITAGSLLTTPGGLVARLRAWPTTPRRPGSRRPEQPSPPPSLPGTSFAGPALELGGLMVDATTLPDVHIRIPLAMLNRHGLVAGATGTGKTKTLQLLAEQLSAAGVPVFAADIKGDLSGLAPPGDRERQDHRAGGRRSARPGRPTALPGRVPSPSAGSGTGIPLRATMTVVRADCCSQGARPQRHPGVLPRPGLPLRRQGRPAAARPRRPARGDHVPDQRRGQGRPRRSSAACRSATAGVILRELIALRGPGRRRVLRRARVRHRRPAADRARRPRHGLAARAAGPAGPARAVLARS